ncbi:hypothetical protein IHE44_0001916 [Lamprotornis superbus]|uniref:PTB-containing, cubilin and LRP1-interacting protein n=1 Tax=Lamprotornis superbus TaxID=245042 RepID=A0A835NQD6_9PASS|nr:hypothetical protein IHE44_0001916 [Lamprotornis superbus]
MIHTARHKWLDALSEGVNGLGHCGGRDAPWLDADAGDRPQVRLHPSAGDKGEAFEVMCDSLHLPFTVLQLLAWEQDTEFPGLNPLVTLQRLCEELALVNWSHMHWQIHFQTMLKTKLNVLTLRKEPLPTVIFHEPEAIELCTTTPLMKARTHTGCKLVYLLSVLEFYDGGFGVVTRPSSGPFLATALVLTLALALPPARAQGHYGAGPEAPVCAPRHLTIPEMGSCLYLRAMGLRAKVQERRREGSTQVSNRSEHGMAAANTSLSGGKVTYLGKVSTTGMQFLSGCTEKPVIELWKKHTLTREDVYPANALLEIRPFQVWLHHLDLKGEATVHMDTFQVARIAYCTADHNVSPNIFAWVYREINDDLSYQMDCHAVECESKLEAKKLAHAMMEAFKKTFHSMKSDGRIHRNSSSEEMSLLTAEGFACEPQPFSAKGCRSVEGAGDSQPTSHRS